MAPRAPGARACCWRLLRTTPSQLYEHQPRVEVAEIARVAGHHGLAGPPSTDTTCASTTSEVALVARSRPTPTASTRSRGTTSDAGCRTSPQLSIGGSIHDPGDPIGKMFFGMLALMAEFASDLIRSRTVETMREAAKRGRLLGKPSKLSVLQRKRQWADRDSVRLLPRPRPRPRSAPTRS